MKQRPWWPWLLLPIGLAFGLTAEYQQHLADRPTSFLIADFTPGLVFLVSGLVVWHRRPRNRCWILLVAAALPWWLGTFQASTDRDVSLVAFAFGRWYDLFLVWLLLAFPSGRVQAARDRLLIVAVAVLLAARTLSRLFLHVPPDLSGCGCVENRFTPVTDPRWFDRVESIYAWGSTIVVLLVLARLVEGWLRATTPRRRMTTPALVAGLLLAAGMAYDNVIRSRIETRNVSQLDIYYALSVGRSAVAIALVVGLIRLGSTRAAVIDLVADLGGAAPPAGLGEAVGRALGDRDLVLLPWSEENGGYVDDSGATFDLDRIRSGRAVTLVEARDEPIAALVHDAALLEDPALVGAVVAAVRLTIDNEQLNRELQERLDEVAASRTRIVEAGDLARQRIERDLHDGAQQRLVAVALALRLAASREDVDTSPELQATLLGAVDELGQAVDELRDLARGIHPAILTDGGLGAALESLADRSSVPLALDVDVGPEPPPTVSATLYFSVAEALTNVAKHAQASTVQVRVARSGDCLRAEVVDDGVGGAEAFAGSGLTGLADRVAAVGGSLRVDRADGGGTRVQVEVPCASS